jgi:DNA-binding transcriptional LysR family regulator
MRDDRFDSIAAFVHAARNASVHRAAERIGTSAATISRRISRLEDQLGVRLLTRTTRRVSLTEAGRTYLERCERVLAALEEADLSVAPEKVTHPSGRLRVTGPGAFGRRHLAPLLAAFSEANPAIELDVLLTDERVDLVDRDIDVAIRISGLVESSFIARKLSDTRRRVCAAPAYLELYGTPLHPSELVAHNGLFFGPYGDAAAWTFTRKGEQQTALPRQTLWTNDIELVFQFARTGRGIAILPDFLTAEARDDGHLVTLLNEYDLPYSSIHALHVSRRHVPLRIRAFLDFLAENLGESLRVSKSSAP